MNFEQIIYKRPNIERFEEQMDEYLKEFILAKSFNEQAKIIESINVLRNELLTGITVADTRYMININDEEYKEEQEHIQKIWMGYQGIVSKYYKVLIESKYKADLENVYGKKLFNIAAVANKTFSTEIIEDLSEEQKLENEYIKVISSARISFNNQELNLDEIEAYLSFKDRDMRKSASEEEFKFMKSRETDLDNIFDSLVRVRTQIAKKLGYKNFIELGYARLERTDYNEDIIKQFRENIVKYIVPISMNLLERQRKRLKLDSLKHYDEPFKYNCENVIPKGNAEWIKEKSGKILQELSKDAKSLFDYLDSNKYMDLITNKNKASGAYTTFLSSPRIPYIFANLNGTQNDIRILMHEFGHAFQMYKGIRNDIPEYLIPTKEAAEIHSMTMEYLTLPWMDIIFGEDADKCRFAFLEEAILAMPRRACVDEFQHIVYLNPNMIIEERKKMWRDLEKKYFPLKDYDSNSYLEEGNAWHLQIQIFRRPFYSINYNLAQLCAIQLFNRAEEDRTKAWEEYVQLCELGGSKSFVELIESCNIISPFEEASFINACKVVEKHVNKIDDLNF
ncbi:M3 family oligoendopeptidase [Clostridium estertheticum]|uniref:M3 family oligoendopeptidase n=1 Tax=Clostridium estertheticum TaxID=238834 RepID=UPI0013E9796E|nr:M3 family oligoendopeptidase [Clostridium estertheticum]MBZ9687464.1 M3 family oligoendopeptidase [Clostridium estertheticum]